MDEAGLPQLIFAVTVTLPLTEGHGALMEREGRPFGIGVVSRPSIACSHPSLVDTGVRALHVLPVERVLSGV